MSENNTTAVEGDKLVKTLEIRGVNVKVMEGRKQKVKPGQVQGPVVYVDTAGFTLPQFVSLLGETNILATLEARTRAIGILATKGASGKNGLDRDAAIEAIKSLILNDQGMSKGKLTVALTEATEALKAFWEEVQNDKRAVPKGPGKAKTPAETKSYEEWKPLQERENYLRAQLAQRPTKSKKTKAATA